METDQSARMEFPSAPTGITANEVARAAAILLGFLILATAGHLLQGRSLYYDALWDPAAIYYFQPADERAFQELASGRLPIWDHSRGLGAPWVMTFVGMDHPLKVLARLLMPNSIWGDAYFFARLWLAGIFAFMLARDTPLGFRGSLFAAVSFMLCGHFREYMNHPGMDIDTMFPIALFLALRAVRTGRAAYFIGAAITASWMDTHPESMAFLTFYAVGLVLTAGSKSWSSVRRAIALFGLGLISAYLLDMDGILPFTEFFFRAWNFHLPEIGQLHFPLSTAIAMFTPVFDYWMASPPELAGKHLEQLTLVPPYAGTVTMVLAIVAGLNFKRLPRLGRYYLIAALALFGLVFGLPPMNLAARLPLLDLFQNFRYSQPFFLHALAMLGGMGVELIIREPRARRLALLIAGAVSLWVAGHLFIFRHFVMASPVVLIGLAVAAAGGVTILGGTWLLRLRRPARRDAILAGALILAAGFELALYFNLAQPLFGPEAFNTAKLPALDFIREREAGNDFGPYRIWGLDQRIVHPNLAGLHGFDDLRDMATMYSRNYFEMISRINGWDTEQEATDGYLKYGKFYLEPDILRMDLAAVSDFNVRYLLSYSPPGAMSLLEKADSILVLSTAPNYVSRADVTMAEVHRRAVIAHAPSLIEMEVKPSAERPLMEMDAGLLGRAATCEGADGVQMAALMQTEGGTRMAFARHFSPRADPHWLAMDFFNMPKLRGLSLISLPGPRDQQLCDFGVWSEPVEFPLSPNSLNLVYDREVRVYELISGSPRVFQNSLALPAESDGGWRAGDNLPFARMQKHEGPFHRAEVKISQIEETTGQLTFRTRSDGPGFVVISNLFYPGWRAYVNGEEQRIHRVNGVMQGLFVGPGESSVRMVYYSPVHRISLWMRWSAWAVFLAALAGIGLRRRR